MKIWRSDPRREWERSLMKESDEALLRSERDSLLEEGVCLETMIGSEDW